MLPTLIATPYNARESMGWVIKHITGPSKKNAHIVGNIPSLYVFNEGSRIKSRLCFVGDIMMTNRKDVTFGPGLRRFVSGCDYLIGNLEGTITDMRKAGIGLAFDQRHSPEIMDILAAFFPPERTYLSLSNNHAGDFGEREFFKSIEILKSRHFNLFGWRDCPYVDIRDRIRIVSGTAWSNRKCEYISAVDTADSNIKPGAFNILYPHFGYEIELYPRPETVEFGKRRLKDFDAVIGHHPHCPQPVTAEIMDDKKKLLAYSLGDFLGAFGTEKYQYGIILKVEVGESQNAGPLLGSIEWRFTRCRPVRNSYFIVDLTEGLPSAWTAS